MGLTMQPTRLVVGLAVATLVACAEGPALQTEPGGVAIVGAQLIDGTGATPVADAVVVIRDGRIRRCRRRDS